MKVSDSDTCVAYYFKRRRHCIMGPIEAQDHRYDFEYIKKYVLHLVDKAKKTKTQKRIKNEIINSMSFNELITIVDRVIENGDKTEFIQYSN